MPRTSRRKNGRRIGFVSTRFAGTDGVSLESAKWAQILWDHQHVSYWYAGKLDRDPDSSMLVPEAYFGDPANIWINERAFGTLHPQPRADPADLRTERPPEGDALRVRGAVRHRHPDRGERAVHSDAHPAGRGADAFHRRDRHSHDRPPPRFLLGADAVLGERGRATSWTWRFRPRCRRSST